MPFFLNESGDLVGDLPDQLSLDLFEAPNPFENVSLDDRLTALRSVAKNAKDSFEIALQSLRKLICNCHPVGLLSHFAFYDLTFPYSEKAEYEPAQQHQVEILQALILTIPPAELGTVPPSPDQRLEAKKLTEEIAQAFMLHRFSPEKTAPVDLIREQMRSATQTIRNPGYSDQIEKNIVALFSPLDEKLKELSGITFSGLFKLWKNYSGRVERRYNAILSTFKELRQISSTEVMLEKFQAEMGVPEEIIADFRARVEEDHLTADQLLAGLWNFLEFTHPEIFVSTLDDFVADYEDKVDRTNLAKALDRWSLQMGELHDRRVDHLFLDNPVWTKPLIALTEQVYFWPIVGTFVSFGLEMFEQQIANDDRLKQAYHDRRAVFLESSVVDILKQAVPAATVYSNIRWFDPKEGETDVLLLVDRHAVIIECKSGRIKPSARRGGGSLDDEIRELIQEPTDQGSRFMKLLLASKAPLNVQDDKGVNHEIPRSKIRRITRVNVLLDFFGMLACEFKQLKTAGLLSGDSRPAVTMSLVDLENLVWMIESPLQLLHYLHRRGQYEESTEVMGDEMDWLACYLAGMFDRWPLEQKLKLQLFRCSEQLDPYFWRRALPVPKKVPRLPLSDWWKAILARLEERKCEGWTEIGMILLSFPHHQQTPYREMVMKIASDMVIDPRLTDGKEMIVGWNTQGGEELAIGTLVFPRISRAEVDQKMHNAIDVLYEQAPEGSNLLLLVPAHVTDIPYFRIVMVDSESEQATA